MEKFIACVVRKPRDPLRSFWDDFVMIWGSYLDHVGIVLESFWDHVAILFVFAQLCVYFGIIVG